MPSILQGCFDVPWSCSVTEIIPCSFWKRFPARSAALMPPQPFLLVNRLFGGILLNLGFFFPACPSLSHGYPWAVTFRTAGFPLDERLCINPRSFPFNIPFFNSTFTGGPHRYFSFKSGRWKPVDTEIFLGICAQFQRWLKFLEESQDLLIITSTTTHKRGGTGGNIQGKQIKSHSQSFLVFTGQVSCCERERKLWFLNIFFPKKEEELGFCATFLSGFSRRKCCTVGKGSLDISR